MAKATPNDTSRSIARAVSTAIKDAGLSENAAATLSGIPQTTLNRKLAGASPLTIPEVAALADVLGVTVAALISMGDAA